MFGEILAHWQLTDFLLEFCQFLFIFYVGLDPHLTQTKLIRPVKISKTILLYFFEHTQIIKALVDVFF